MDTDSKEAARHDADNHERAALDGKPAADELSAEGSAAFPLRKATLRNFRPH